MLSAPSVQAAHTLSGAAQLSQPDINNVCPLLTSRNAQASKTDSTVMGNSQQSSSVTSRDWATAVAAASSPAPVRAMSSNMFSVLSHLDDCGDEGSGGLNDALFVEHYSRRSAKRRRQQSRQQLQQQRSSQEQQRQVSRAAEGNSTQQRDAQRGDGIAAQSRGRVMMTGKSKQMAGQKFAAAKSIVKKAVCLY